MRAGLELHRSRGEVPPIVRVHGIEHGRAAFDFGAVIIATVHVGAFESAAALIAEHYPERNVTVVGENVTAKRAVARQVAERYGWAAVSAHDTDACKVAAWLTCSDPTGVLIVLTDVYVPGQHSAAVEFVGRTVKLPTGPAFLSIETGAVILPVVSYLVDGGSFVHIAPPLWLSTGDTYDGLTQRLADVMTDFIADAPDQWFPPRALEPA